MKEIKLRDSEVLVLSRCNKDFTSYNGITYPEIGFIEDTNWDNTSIGGLRGLLWGCGDYDITSHGDMWQLIKIDTNDGFIDYRSISVLYSGVKFRRGEVLISSSNQVEVLDALMQYVPAELKYKVKYRIVAVGNYSSIECGDNAMITGGTHSNIICGHNSIVTAGHYSTVKAGADATIHIGSHSNVIAGWGAEVVSHTGTANIRIEGYGVVYLLNNGKPKVLTSGVDFAVGSTVHIINNEIQTESPT